jgi:hypothetical protein
MGHLPLKRIPNFSEGLMYWLILFYSSEELVLNPIRYKARRPANITTCESFQMG